ncbi:MAG: VanW family protein [Selenomonadaceae bacterium]|nr:VanW family protein [Selenomonadaceae bacterium]
METSEIQKFNMKNFLSAKTSMIAAASVAVVGAGTLIASNVVADSGEIVSGVRVDGRPLSGLNQSSAEKVFNDIGAAKIHNLTFTYNGETFQITPEEINWKPQTAKATQEAMSYGRGGTTLGNLRDQFNCMTGGRDVKLTAEYDAALLTEKLKGIAAHVHKDPVNAVCSLGNGDVIEKTPGVIGKELNVDKLAESLKDPLSNLTLSKDAIALEPDDIMPFITTEDIENIDSILGSYSTYYSPGDRGYNIWLASESISHKIVKPSWIFSFNDTVGPRTWSAGYRMAGVIIDGRPDTDYGGGVCQVSSTLYNAVLYAGLTPTERTPHYFQSTYVAPGRDATVADGQLDFKFRNDLPHNVYLLAYAGGSTLSVYVLGTKADLGGAEVSLETDGSSMSPSLYRVYYNGNDVVKSEYLHTDSYQPPKPRREQD